MTRRPSARAKQSDRLRPYYTVSMRPVSYLLPYAGNARTHRPEQVRQIADSIRQFGFANPVLIAPDNEIIAGHGRVLAAREAGMTEVPVIVAQGWTTAQRRAYVIADNQIALNAGWDKDLLSFELSELSLDGFDLALTGFSPTQLTTMLPSPDADQREDSDAPDAPDDPVSRPGDVWLLGEHRLMCGDATQADHVAVLLGPERPHLMVTDPPYGVSYDPNWRRDAGAKGPGRTGKVKNDDVADWRAAWDLFPGTVAYVWHSDRNAKAVIDGLTASRFEIRAGIVWVKPAPVIGRGDYQWQHEPALYCVRKLAKSRWAGGSQQSTVWQIPSRSKTDEDSVTIHGTQKPVETMRRPILNNSRSGDSVYEPFSGSGTTIIAAETTGRRCVAMEIDPAYVDVAVARWQTFTGSAAALEGRPGATFGKISEVRQYEDDTIKKARKAHAGSRG